MAKGPIGERGRDDEPGEGRRYSFGKEDAAPPGEERAEDAVTGGGADTGGGDGGDDGDDGDEAKRRNPVSDTFSKENVRAAGAKVSEEAKRAAGEFREDFKSTGWTGEEGETLEDLSEETRLWALLAHVGIFSQALGVPLGHIVAPLIVYLVKKDGDPFIVHHARESLNFQISMTIWFILAGIFTFLTFGIGIVIVFVLLMMELVLVIVASVRAWTSTVYRYPLTIRFIR